MTAAMNPYHDGLFFIAVQITRADIQIQTILTHGGGLLRSNRLLD